jgi:hypothetical protein
MMEDFERGVPLGHDMDGDPIYPNDVVFIDGDESQPMRIKYGTYTEQFGCGKVIGWYVPDFCRKKPTQPANDTP